MKYKEDVLLNPVRFKLLTLFTKEKSSMFAREIAEELCIDRRQVSYHLKKLEDAGIVSSTTMANPGAKSGGKYSRYYRLTPSALNFFSAMMRELRHIEEQHDQYDFRKAISSSEVKKSIMDKLRVKIEEKSRNINKRTNVVDFIREIILKIGIEITALEIRGMIAKDGETIDISVSEPELVQVVNTLFISGEASIYNTPIKFVAVIKKDEEQKMGVQSCSLESIILDRTEIDDNEARTEKISTYSQYVQLITQCIVLILQSILNLARTLA